MAERTYTDGEAHAIFARAAHRQEAVREADERAAAGLTLAELQAVGAEAGIDPALVLDAARALDGTAPTPVRTVLGVPDRVVVTRTLPAPLGEAGWTALVDALRQSFGQEGRAEHLGARREWRVGDPAMSADAVVRVEPGEGGDVATFEERLGGGGMLVAPLLPLGLMVFFLLGTFEPAVPILMGALALAMALAVRFGVPAWGRVQARRFEAAVDAVELALLRAHREVEAERGTAPPSRLDVGGDAPASDRRRTPPIRT